ncbi:MAG: hypothetical protein ACJAU3_000824 [Zhongshania sp.]|jgi:hypothetical protein
MSGGVGASFGAVEQALMAKSVRRVMLSRETSLLRLLRPFNKAMLYPGYSVLIIMCAISLTALGRGLKVDILECAFDNELLLAGLVIATDYQLYLKQTF